MRVIGRYMSAGDDPSADDDLLVLDIALKENKLIVSAADANCDIIVHTYDVDSGSLTGWIKLETDTDATHYWFLYATERGFAVCKPDSEIIVFDDRAGAIVNRIPITSICPDILYNGDFIATVDWRGTLVISNIFNNRSRIIKAPSEIGGKVVAVDVAMESAERQYVLYRLDTLDMVLAIVCKDSVKPVWSDRIYITHQHVSSHPLIKCACANRLLLRSEPSIVFDFDSAGNLTNSVRLSHFAALVGWRNYLMGVPLDSPNRLCVRSGQTDFVLDSYKEDIYDIKSFDDIIAVRLHDGGVILYKFEHKDMDMMDRCLISAALSSV